MLLDSIPSNFSLFTFHSSLAVHLRAWSKQRQITNVNMPTNRQLSPCLYITQHPLTAIPIDSLPPKNSNAADIKQSPVPQITPPLNLLPGILHLLPKHSAENHLDIFHKRIMPIIITVQPHLVRIYNHIVILLSDLPHGARVSSRLARCHKLRDHLILKVLFFTLS